MTEKSGTKLESAPSGAICVVKLQPSLPAATLRAPSTFLLIFE